VTLTKDNLTKGDGQDVLNVSFAVLRNQLIIYLYLALLHTLFGELCITYNIPPPTSINNLFGNWLYGIDKKIKA
jgi:hypothetical protein